MNTNPVTRPGGGRQFSLHEDGERLAPVVRQDSLTCGRVKTWRQVDRGNIHPQTLFIIISRIHNNSLLDVRTDPPGGLVPN